MNPQDILSELSVKIYEPPLNAARHNGAIADMSDPLNVAMLILDFETEISMNGIINFLGNSTGRFAHQTVAALEKVGCAAEAALLRQIIDIAENAGMTHEAIQQERAKLEPYAVTSFSQLHGDKWDIASKDIRKIEADIDYSQIISATERFVGQHPDRFQKALEQ